MSPRGCAEPPNFTLKLLEPLGVTVMPAGAAPTSLKSVSGPSDVTETVAVADVLTGVLKRFGLVKTGELPIRTVTLLPSLSINWSASVT